MSTKAAKTTSHATRIVVLLCVVLTLAIPISAWGQAPMTNSPAPVSNRMPTASNELKRLSQKLKLTNEQKPKVEAVVLEMHKQMDSTMKDDSLSFEEKIQSLKKVREDSNAAVRAMLTAEQQKKFDKLVIENDEQMAPPDGAPWDGPPPGGATFRRRQTP